MSARIPAERGHLPGEAGRLPEDVGEARRPRLLQLARQSPAILRR